MCRLGFTDVDSVVCGQWFAVACIIYDAVCGEGMEVVVCVTCTAEGDLDLFFVYSVLCE